MTVIQDILKQKLLNHLDELCNKSKIKINGAYVDYSVFKTYKDGDVLRKYLYMETEVGYVEEAQLLSPNNEVLAIKPLFIDKQDDGLVIAFEFKLTVEEVSV